MKKIVFLLLAASLQIFSQEISNKTLELENHFARISDTEFKSELSISSLPKTERKNTGLAIIYSLLLPGMGELYAGSYSSGKYFTIAEGLLWGTFIGMNSYAGWQKDRYKSYAESFGGVDNTNKDEEYYANISLYLSVDEFNDDQAKNREFRKMYNDATFNWDWQTVENRKTYRGMWTSSEEAYNNLRFVVGAMVLNRIASAINAVRLVSAHNKQLAEEISWNISAGVNNSKNLPPSFTLNFLTTF